MRSAYDKVPEIRTIHYGHKYTGLLMQCGPQDRVYEIRSTPDWVYLNEAQAKAVYETQKAKILQARADKNAKRVKPKPSFWKRFFFGSING